MKWSKISTKLQRDTIRNSGTPSNNAKMTTQVPWSLPKIEGKPPPKEPHFFNLWGNAASYRQSINGVHLIMIKSTKHLTESFTLGINEILSSPKPLTYFPPGYFKSRVRSLAKRGKRTLKLTKWSIQLDRPRNFVWWFNKIVILGHFSSHVKTKLIISIWAPFWRTQALRAPRGRRFLVTPLLLSHIDVMTTIH